MATPHRLRHHAGALCVEWHVTRSLVEDDENDGRGTREAQRAVPDHKDRRCPSCGSAAVRAIVYGLVEDPATFVGQCVAFGGCCVAPNDPTRRCDVCGHEWGRVEGDTPTFRPYQLLRV